MILFIAVVTVVAILSQNSEGTPLSIKNKVFTVEIANTSQKREQGLCCRDSLAVDRGMLFVYDSPGDYRFWMKDTRIPLDMIWISSSKRIVHIEESVQPDTYPESFRSDKPAQYVLELNAGSAKKYNFQNRDKVAFEL
ncbi:DUF192 domain-containing protein [Candidatus Saccharibacteria bacterium]|nr:DUF192 domain-containing protein [Candidatus Saccharibacteria bacterium]